MSLSLFNPECFFSYGCLHHFCLLHEAITYIRIHRWCGFAVYYSYGAHMVWYGTGTTIVRNADCLVGSHFPLPRGILSATVFRVLSELLGHPRHVKKLC